MFKTKIFYLLIFIVLLLIGFSMAAKKPLWGDEIFSQMFLMDQSYLDILFLKSPIEGNISPLFYIQQKLLCDLFGFHTPQEWVQGNWMYRDTFTNLFLRILPVTWMSLSFLLIFIFFYKRFNLLIGLLGLYLAFSSKLLLVHWVEARPYGLWVLLTICQTLLFINILEAQKLSIKNRILLFFSHILLGATCSLSIFQILTVSIILMYKKIIRYRDFLIFLIPLFLIYYYQPPRSFNHTLFTQTIPEIIQSVFPMDRLLILLLFPVGLGVYFLQKWQLYRKAFVNDVVVKSIPFFMFIGLILIETWLFLTFLRTYSQASGYIVLGRHIIFLVPIGIIAISYLAGILWKSLKQPFWLQCLFLLIFLVFLLPF